MEAGTSFKYKNYVKQQFMISNLERRNKKYFKFIFVQFKEKENIESEFHFESIPYIHDSKINYARKLNCFCDLFKIDSMIALFR